MSMLWEASNNRFISMSYCTEVKRIEGEKHTCTKEIIHLSVFFLLSLFFQKLAYTSCRLGPLCIYLYIPKYWVNTVLDMKIIKIINKMSNTVLVCLFNCVSLSVEHAIQVNPARNWKKGKHLFYFRFQQEVRGQPGHWGQPKVMKFLQIILSIKYPNIVEKYSRIFFLWFLK